METRNTLTGTRSEARLIFLLALIGAASVGTCFGALVVNATQTRDALTLCNSNTRCADERANCWTVNQ